MFTMLALWGCGGEPTPPPLPCDGAYEVYDPEVLFGAGDFVASVEVEEDPAVGPNSWVFDLRNRSDVPVSGASVTLTPMHIATGELLEPDSYRGGSAGSPGRYAIEAFELPRDGGWGFEFLVASGMENRVLLLELCIQ